MREFDLEVAQTVKENLTVETPTCKDSLQVPRDIIERLKSLEDKLYNLQYLIGEAMDVSCNTIRELDDINNIIIRH